MSTLHNDIHHYSNKHHLKNIYDCLRCIVFSCLVLSILSACETPTNNISKNITANWDNATSTLSVSGTSEKTHKYVEIHDSAGSTFLGSAIVKDDGSWSASSTTPACTVHIELPTGTAVVDVKNAPTYCTARKGVSTRSISMRDIPVNTKVVANPIANEAVPNAVILEPAMDLAISTGESVNFRGSVVGTGITDPIAYRWNFGGVASNSTIQNPGTIQFNTPGIYFIQLSATDNLGIPDPTPATRTIVVTDPNTVTAAPPKPVITSPSTVNGAITIGVGQSLIFSGLATNDAGTAKFFYEWDFSGTVPNQFGQTPGEITFYKAGDYVVNLYATDPQGVRSPEPATIVVSVEANGTNQAPSGLIISPPSDIVIHLGDTLSFIAQGLDPDKNVPLLYSWDFQGAETNITMSPDAFAADITFNEAGVFNIGMSVTDALGQKDSNPPTRVVTVLEATQASPASNEIITQITSPINTINILPGESIVFNAEVIGDANNQVSRYLWNFDGGAIDSTLRSPGSVTFTLPGTYNVIFYAMDDLGNIVATPDMTTVTVLDPSVSVTPGQAPLPIIVGTAIVSPLPGIAITNPVGGVVVFQGNIINATNVIYNWDFAGAAAPSNLQNPPPVIFDTAGVYLVTLRISGLDDTGATVEIFDHRYVTVTQFPTFPETDILGIAFPPSDLVINIGDTVDFRTVQPITGNVTFLWDFVGNAANSTSISPPPVQFNMAGSFLIRLIVSGTYANGQPIIDVIDRRTITVLPPSQALPLSTSVAITNSTTPQGDIIEPSSSAVNVKIGQSLAFTGVGFDPQGLGPLSFEWSFGGLRENIETQNPGNISFNQLGTYVVTLLVKNVTGQYDPTPATVVVTVVP